MRKILFAVAFMVVGAANADDSLCQDASFIEARNCSEKESQLAQARLDKAYAKLESEIPRKYGAEASMGVSSEASAVEVIAALRKSQQAWVSYREAHCKYEYEGARGGTGTASDHAERICLVRLTRERTMYFEAEIRSIESYAK